MLRSRRLLGNAMLSGNSPAPRMRSCFSSAELNRSEKEWTEALRQSTVKA